MKTTFHLNENKLRIGFLSNIKIIIIRAKEVEINCIQA